MAEVHPVRVSVLLAEPGQQHVVRLELPAGATAWQAVEASRLLEGRQDVDPAGLAVAVFGKQVVRGHVLEDQDRVEVLWPLHEDPRSRRRRMAATGGRR